MPDTTLPRSIADLIGINHGQSLSEKRIIDLSSHERPEVSTWAKQKMEAFRSERAKKNKKRPQLYNAALSQIAGSPAYITPEAMREWVSKVEMARQGFSVEIEEDDEEEEPFEMFGSVAVVKIHGTLMANASEFDIRCGACDIFKLRDTLRELANKTEVRGVVASFCTGGGSVTGISEFAELVRNYPKPIIAHTETMCASAGYFIASQAPYFYVSLSSISGSIGTYVASFDESKAHEMAGLSPVIIKSEGSDLKAAGALGTPLTGEQRNSIQERVNYLNGVFKSAVSIARPNVSQDAFNGDHFYGEKAIALGLADFIAPIETAIRDVEILANLQTMGV